MQIISIPHPTYPDETAYVVPIIRGGKVEHFWLGQSLDFYRERAASKSVSMEAHIENLVKTFLKGDDWQFSEDVQ